jgi:hypothetical protein
MLLVDIIVYSIVLAVVGFCVIATIASLGGDDE